LWNPPEKIETPAMLDLQQLRELCEQHADALANPVQSFDIGGRAFDFGGRTSVMGVINLSPDSWYRESVCLDSDAAIRRGKVLAAQGADLVDVGAESTLAHAARLDDRSQSSKLLPVVRGLVQAGILVSAETYDPAVAQAVLEAGAHVLNLTGTGAGETIYRLVADHDAAVILCYVQGANAREVGDFDFGADSIGLMADSFSREIDRAVGCGVKRIFIDPGLGFYYRNLQDSAVRVRHQLRTFLNTFRLRKLGWPICHALPHAFEFFREEVRCAEPFFAVLAALGGTNLFRTHEVPRTRAVLETLAAY
jgi:dihydropteroate synthase